MGKRINIRAAIKSANREHWCDAIYWLLFTFIGSLFAVYGGVFLLKLVSQKVALSDLCKNGEFALYSAAILVTIFHLVWKDAYKGPFVNLRLFGSISIILFIFASFIFAGVTTANAISGEKPSVLDLRILIPSSIGTFLATLVIGFLTTLVDAVRVAPDLTKIQESEQEDLKEAFRKTGDENGES